MLNSGSPPRGSLSQKGSFGKSLQVWVNDKLFEEFESLNLEEILAYALSVRLGIPKKNITSYPARTSLHFNCYNSVLIHVAIKALITVVVCGVDRTEVRKHADMIIAVLTGNMSVEASEIQILCVLPYRITISVRWNSQQLCGRVLPRIYRKFSTTCSLFRGLDI